MSSNELELSQPSDDDITADQDMSDSSDNPTTLQGPTPPRVRRCATTSTVPPSKRERASKKPAPKAPKALKPKAEPKSSKKRKIAEEEKAIEGKFAFLTFA